MKKKISVFTLNILLLAAPCALVASPKPVDFSRLHGAAGFFAGVQYKPAYPLLGGFALSNGDEVLELFALKKDSEEDLTNDIKSENFLGKYTPTYLKNTTAASVSGGYSTGHIRCEVEGMLQKFAVDASRFRIPQNAAAFAASPPDESAVSIATKPAEKYFLSLQNKEVNISSLVVNACYDLVPEEYKVSPSACVGAGISFVDFLGVTERRWTYQAKAGLQYFLSRKAVFFGSMYVQKMESKKFKNVNVKHHIKVTPKAAPESAAQQQPQAAPAVPAAKESVPTLLYPDASLDISYYGIEAGIRLIL